MSVPGEQKLNLHKTFFPCFRLERSKILEKFQILKSGWTEILNTKLHLLYEKVFSHKITNHIIIWLYTNSCCNFNLIIVSCMSIEQIWFPGSGWLPALSIPGKAFFVVYFYCYCITYQRLRFIVLDTHFWQWNRRNFELCRMLEAV